MTQIGLQVEIRFCRIPTLWTIERIAFRKQLRAFAVPVIDRENTKTLHLDGWTIRNRFLRLVHTEEAALAFLNDVGVYDLSEQDVDFHPESKKQLLDGNYGGRLLGPGLASHVPLRALFEDQTYWRSVLLDPELMKETQHPTDLRIFDRSGNPPSKLVDKERQAAIFNRHFNELPLRVEWQDGRPKAVIETVTCRELLIATTHLDVLRRARFKICRRPDCAIPFPVTSGHNRKYCEWYCGHLESVRKRRREEKCSRRVKGMGK